jgi:O-succinylbenzoic acid--CoA ligase
VTPTTPATFPDWLASRVDVMPHKAALIAGDRTWSYRELDAEVTRAAHLLAGRGVNAGDRIATVLRNGLVAAVLPHAALRLDATLVPLNVRLSDAELTWQLGDASPRVIVVDERMAARVASAGAATVVSVHGDALPLGDAHIKSRPALRLSHDAESVAAMIYTSGTTGQPKAAMLTVGNFWWSAIGSALNIGSHADDRWLACLPLFHVGGLSIVMRSAIYGIAAVVHDLFDAEMVNRAIDEQAVTIVSMVAVMLERVLDARQDRAFPSTLRCVLLGGGPASAALLDRCAAIALPVVQTYGLTECCSQVATLAPDEARRRPGSAGMVLYPNELRIAAMEGGASADGAGEILVRGPIVMAGYAGRSDATARAIVDGWLHTGDIGRLDDEGYLYVLDRRDDLIITGGENVYPAEVESVLLSHPDIAEVAVVGVADARWGQRIVAVVRLRDEGGAEIDVASLDAFCRARLGPYKVPREFRVAEEPLPRTASGKVRRGAVRALVAGSETD